MTNGEKMQEVFPEGKTRRCRDGVVFESDGWCHAYHSDWWDAEYKESTTKNDSGVDCISRAEAIKCLECDFDITGKENMKTVVNYINSAHDKIVNLPRVKQEPRKGHWIKGYTFPDGEYWKCDKCNELIKVKYPMYYCNNCGSDNREVKE